MKVMLQIFFAEIYKRIQYNVTSTTESWESTNWTHKITDIGKFNWTDEAFIIAEKMELIHTLQYQMIAKHIPQKNFKTNF